MNPYEAMSREELLKALEHRMYAFINEQHADRWPVATARRRPPPGPIAPGPSA